MCWQSEAACRRRFLGQAGKAPSQLAPTSSLFESPADLGAPQGYPNTTGFRKVTKVTVLIKKKEGMSDEDFIEHYNHVHAQMAAPVVQKHKAISYSLTYHLSRDRNIMQDMLHGKAQLLPYDAICTFVFPDYKCFAKFMYDPASKALTGDHDNFMDESQMTMMVGDEFVLIENGERVN